MKRLPFLCLCLVALCSRAAVPTFQSFEPTQFDTNNFRVAYRDPWTNDVGIVYQALPNSLTLITNLNSYGTFSLPSKVTLLTLGTNYLDLSTNSTWLLNSPTNDAAQVILSLSAGAYQGQFAFLTSQNGSNSFTLPDLSEQWDVPGAYVDIQGSWIGTTNRGIILQYVAPDWVEMARFDPSQTGGGTVLGGGTTPFLPYWINGSTLTNSPLSRSGASSVQIAQGGGFLQLGVGSGIPFVSGISLLQISAGSGVLLMNGGSYLTPESGGVGIVLGTGTNYFGGLFLGTNGLHGEYTDDGSQFLRNGVPLGGTNDITINPTDNFLPVRTSATAFGNSLFSQSGDVMTMRANNVQLNVTGTNSFDMELSAGAGKGSVFIYGDSNSGNVLVNSPNAADYANLSSQNGNSILELKSGGTVRTQLYPGQISTGSGIAYNFDTQNALSTGDLLARFRNLGTNKFTINNLGATSLGNVTKAQKTSMTPQDGMIVYQTDNTPGFRGYVNGTWFIFSMAADP